MLDRPAKFNWKDYMTVASHLLNCELTYIVPEASLRSAISRSYYAAFSLAKNYALENGLEISDRE